MFKLNFIYKILIFSCVCLLALCTCQRKSHEINPGIKVHFNKLNIIWKGINRLNGGIPVLENTKLKFHEVHTVEKDTVFIFEFLHNFEDHVEIKAIISPVNNWIIFYLSPNNYHTQKASDFLGILFDEIPEMQNGTAFYNGLPVEIKGFSELKADSAEFLLLKYKDGNYAACLPLQDRGFKATCGTHEDKFGFKSHHSKDGHNENDIPIAAIAFGDNPQLLLKALLNEPKIKANSSVVNLSF